ncbi:mannose-binding protein C-like [Phlebotomus argentipes]|uniref:mannose-binding protein C-like n=1 Tax=Phlebotomus argentipes TaxID=94469 RepID=UPI0028932A51|nr:mannose-binding protein C-like [Phlebotomus argentipes]
MLQKLDIVLRFDLHYRDGKYLYIGHNKVSWLEAVEECKKLNMTLVTIRSEEENSAVLTLLKENRVTLPWIGGYNYQENGEFRWIATGELFSYTKWHNDMSNTNDSNRNCVYMEREGTWNNFNCMAISIYMCELVVS